MKSKKLVFICQAAVIAALYVVLTYVFSAFASGVIHWNALSSADRYTEWFLEFFQCPD